MGKIRHQTDTITRQNRETFPLLFFCQTMWCPGNNLGKIAKMEFFCCVACVFSAYYVFDYFAGQKKYFSKHILYVKV